MLQKEKEDLTRQRSQLDTDLGLALSNLTTAERSNRDLRTALSAEKEARTLADSALVTVEDTGREKYKASETFKEDTLSLARQEHLGALAHEWLSTDAGERYLLAVGKEDFYSGFLLLQKEIYVALKAKDLEFTTGCRLLVVAGYGLRYWLSPPGKGSSALTADQSTSETEGQIPMDHAYLNSSANMRSLESIERPEGIRLSLSDTAALTIVDLEAAVQSPTSSGPVEGVAREEEAPAS